MSARYCGTARLTNFGSVSGSRAESTSVAATSLPMVDTSFISRCGWVLRKLANAGPSGVGRGCYWDEHELLQTASGERLKNPDWEWADIDRKRLVWAEAGKLFAASIENQGIGRAHQLFDFNEMSFERIEAPY